MSISNVYVKSTVTTQLFIAAGEQAVTTMFFCNVSDSLDTELDIFLTPSTDAVSTASQVIKSLPLAATETYVFDAERLILDPGDKIFAKATIDSIVVATISSVQTS